MREQKFLLIGPITGFPCLSCVCRAKQIVVLTDVSCIRAYVLWLCPRVFVTACLVPACLVPAISLGPHVRVRMRRPGQPMAVVNGFVVNGFVVNGLAMASAGPRARTHDAHMRAVLFVGPNRSLSRLTPVSRGNRTVPSPAIGQSRRCRACPDRPASGAPRIYQSTRRSVCRAKHLTSSQCVCMSAQSHRALANPSPVGPQRPVYASV